MNLEEAQAKLSRIAAAEASSSSDEEDLAPPGRGFDCIRIASMEEVRGSECFGLIELRFTGGNGGDLTPPSRKKLQSQMSKPANANDGHVI